VQEKAALRSEGLNDNNQRRTTMADSPADGRTLAERYVTMMNQHNPDGVDSFVAVDYINHNPLVEDGREGNRTLWRAFFAAFPDIKVTMEDLVVAGDRVIGRFTYRGTHDGPLWGIPATGNRIEMRSIDIWRTGNGEFVEHWDELNLLDVFQQIGVIPAFELGN
jgi:predicted ester cyclase